MAVKRQLQVYYWKGKDFLEHSENIDLPDIPRTLVWCDQTVVIGCKNEYYLFDVSLHNLLILSITVWQYTFLFWSVFNISTLYIITLGNKQEKY